MKTYFIFLCLLISGGLVSASTQTTANQDKPPRLYVKSYSEEDNQSGLDYGTNVYPYAYYNGSYTFGTNIYTQTQTYQESLNNWQDGAPGSFTQTTYYQESDTHGPNGTQDTIATLSWPQGSWPNLSGTEVVSSTGDWIYDWPYTYHTNTFTTSTSTNQSVLIYQEHCDINIISNWTSYIGSGSGTWIGTDNAKTRRTAQTTMHLQTGGKATSKLKNLFRLTGSVSKINDGITDWEGDLVQSSSQGISSQNINIGSYGNLDAAGVLYVTLPDNADVDVTPSVAGVDYYSFTLNQSEVQTKADWQQVVQYEIDNDSGVKIENYAAGNGFLTNRANIQAVYAFYQKLFTEQPTWYYWAGLAKLAGAPVYAGLSDGEYVKAQTTNFAHADQTAVTNFVNSFQQTLIGMNIAILNDLAWQFEAYKNGGTNAIYQAWVSSSFDTTVLDQNAMDAWVEINQGIQQNVTTNIPDGNQKLLRREQNQILASGYSALNTLSPLITWGMSQFAENPVPGGPDFITMEPSGNIGDFDARWDWITHPTTGMWWLWLGASTSTQLGWVQIPLVTRAGSYAQYTPVY